MWRDKLENFAKKLQHPAWGYIHSKRVLDLSIKLAKEQNYDIDLDSIIAASFLAPPVPNLSLGLATTLAVIAHEIPQEMGDFSILIYGGFSRVKALSYNFMTATIAIFAAVLTYFASAYLSNLEYLLAFAAGGFIYIATTDLIPELHKERNLPKSVAQFILLALGIMLMWVLKR